MKKLTALLLCLLLCMAIVLPAAASPALISDQAGLLTDSQISQLELISGQMGEDYGIDAAIVILDSLGGKEPQAAADDYYDYSGFREDGVLFLLSMSERQWYISTSGSMIYTLTDYALYEIEDIILPYLKDGAYYDAFAAFLRSLPHYLDAYESGSSIDGFVPEEDRYQGHTDVVYAEDEYSTASSILIGCGAGLIVAAIAVLIMRSGMNSKRPQHSAEDYLKEGSYNLRTNRDVFLYSQVTKKPKPKPSDSNSGNRGGGSGVHRSSSGSSHGGRGGGF